MRFEDWDGKELKTQKVEEGHDATPPDDPVREGYTFIGWSGSYKNVQKNLTLKAQYKENEEGIESLKHSDGSIQKVLRDGVIYIEREGKIYDAAGVKIR